MFVGWVPTANGRLSFRHIGDTDHPRLTKYANFVGERDVRHIAGYQERNLSDALFAPVTELVMRISGRFTFSIVCKSTEEDEAALDFLLGMVGIYIPHGFESVRRSLDDCVDCMNNLRLVPGRRPDAEKQFDEFERLNGNADVLIKFALCRNGDVKFENPVFRDGGVESRSVSASQDSGVEFYKWIANQAYFFLRDLSHHHQHHAPSSDTILVLQEESAPRGWQNNILYSLHHYIIKMRRSPREIDLQKALGVLGYAQAFVGICKLKRTELSEFQPSAVSDSINARSSEMNLLQTDKNQRRFLSSAYRGTFIAIYLAVLSIMISMLQPFIAEKKESIRWAAALIIDHYIASITIAISILLLGVVISSEAAFNVDRRRRFIHSIHLLRDLLTIGSMRRPRTIGFILIVASVFLALFIIWRAINSL